MSSRKIKDNQISASNDVLNQYGPEQSRYFIGLGWCVRNIQSSTPQFKEYLQIDLMKPYTITQLWLQGARSPTFQYSYGSEFQLQYKLDGSFLDYTDKHGKLVSTDCVESSLCISVTHLSILYLLQVIIQKKRPHTVKDDCKCKSVILHIDKMPTSLNYFNISSQLLVGYCTKTTKVHRFLSA